MKNLSLSALDGLFRASLDRADILGKGCGEYSLYWCSRLFCFICFLYYLFNGFAGASGEGKSDFRSDDYSGCRRWSGNSSYRFCHRYCRYYRWCCGDVGLRIISNVLRFWYKSNFLCKVIRFLILLIHHHFYFLSVFENEDAFLCCMVSLV